MKRKILIEKAEGQVRTFILEDDKIAEIHCSSEQEDGAKDHRLGNIYVGRVKNIVPNIGAAFIEIESGFNCYYDVKDVSMTFFTKKTGKKPLCIGDELVVQISKEASRTKVPTVTGNLSFTGRYAVLTHGNKRIGVSSKLPRSMREKFREQLGGYQEENFGIIVRTNAKNVEFAEVMKEIESLREQYRQLLSAAPYRTCFSCLRSSPPGYITDLKNVYMDGMEEIIVDDRELYTRIQSYFEKESPELCRILRLYDNPDFPLCKLYGTESALKKALQERVWLRHGGYLVIQPTEALTVIDVNSGKHTGKGSSEESIMKINLEAAEEAAHQIRVRNLSGIILIDFINLEQPENISTLLREFRAVLEADPVQTTLVDITPLNLVEVTRKKVYRPLAEQVEGI